MLFQLHIKNLALIEQADLTWEPGLTVLSGETGAGKSILIDSINLALGAKMKGDMLRAGEKEGLVELIFAPDEKQREKIQELERDFSQELLVLSRKIYEGRSILRINDETASRTRAKSLTEILLDIHGQHEHQSLLSSDRQLEILDSYCKGDLQAPKQQLRRIYRELREIREKISQGIDKRQRTRELDILAFEIKELEEACIKEGEEEALEEEFRRYKNMAKISAGLEKALEGLESQELGEGIREAFEASEYDKVLYPIRENLTTVESLVFDATRQIRSYLEGLDYDEGHLDAITERLDEIRHIKAKYSKDVKKILGILQEKRKRQAFLQEYEARYEEWKTQAGALEREALEQAKTISQIRREAAGVLREKILQELEDLNFLGVEFEIRLERKEKLGPEGFDEAAFFISTNPGNPMKPLKNVASGGELSRIMLALKTVFADSDDIGTLIFDEIDTGISGKTAAKVGEKLYRIARNRQVFCISHLPQIAVMADQHLFLSKSTDGLTTRTNIKVLDREGRIGEIARLMGGSRISEGILASAREMTAEADLFKKICHTSLQP